VTFDVGSKRGDQSIEEILGLQAAGLPQGKDSFHSTVPLFTGSTLRPFAPEESKAEHAFGMTVCGSNALFDKKEPQGVDFFLEPSGKIPCCVLAVPMQRYQSDEPGIQGWPLPYPRWTMCHAAEPLQFRESPVHKPGNPGVFPLGDFPGFADQMGKSTLPYAPTAVDTIAIADQNAFPVANQSFKGFRGAVSVNHEESHRGVCHHPEPLKHFLLAKRSLINEIDFALSSYFANFNIVGLESRGDTVNDFLDGAKAYGDSQDRSAELLNDGAAVALASAIRSMVALGLGPHPMRYSLGSDALLMFPQQEQTSR
jgi:hypothetical protein